MSAHNAECVRKDCTGCSTPVPASSPDNTEALAWGDMPYDGKTPREVIDDYVLVRGDLSAEYARQQLATWIDRYAAAERARAQAEALALVPRCSWHVRGQYPDTCWWCKVNSIQRDLREAATPQEGS